MKVEEKEVLPVTWWEKKGGVYLLLGHLQQAGWAKGCADAEKGKRGVLRFPVLTVQLLYLASDVQPLQSTR